jgi:hypothetical protein
LIPPYKAIRQLAARIFAARTDAPVERIATPKVDVSAAVFDNDERVPMI